MVFGFEVPERGMSKKAKFDVDDCMEAVGFGRFQYRLLVACGIGVMADSGE